MQYIVRFFPISFRKYHFLQYLLILSPVQYLVTFQDDNSLAV